MRKLLAVLVLLGMSIVCTSAFGYTLTYSLNLSMKGFDFAENASAENIPMKAYLVLTFDDLDDTFLDANMILYGRDPNGDRNQRKIFVVLDMSTNGFLNASYSFYGDFAEIDLIGEMPFGFEALLLGKTKPVNIGTEFDEDVAPVLKGVIWQFNGVLSSNSQDIIATGTAKASLQTGFTKSANQNVLTQDDVVDQLLTTKFNKYKEVEIETFDDEEDVNDVNEL